MRIDGHDLREITIDSLRSQLGVVPQEPFLFAGVVRDNVAFARPDADDAELQAALDAVLTPSGLRLADNQQPGGA